MSGFFHVVYGFQGSSTYLVAYVSAVFLLVTESDPTGWMDGSHSVRSSVDEHFGCSHFLSIMNNALNVCVDMFFQFSWDGNCV